MVKHNASHCSTMTSAIFYLINAFIFLLLVLPVVNIKVTFWWLDNLLNLQIQWSLLALSLIIINLIYIKKFIILLSFLYAITITYNLMPLYFPIATPLSQHIKTPNIKAMSLNVAQLNLSYENPNLKQLLPKLGSKKIDLLVLEEAADTEYKNLKILEQYYPYSFGMGSLESTPSGMAIFSRWPIIEKKIHNLGYKSGQIIEVLIQTPEANSPVQLFSFHPGSPRNEALWKSRNKTLITAAEHINNSPFTNKIIIGDFNNTLWTHSFKAFQNRTQLKNSAYGFGYIPSWSYSPNSLISFISSAYIDHNLVSENFTVLDKKALVIKGSDHLLIITKLAIFIGIAGVDLQNAKKNKGNVEKTDLSTNVNP